MVLLTGINERGNGECRARSDCTYVQADLALDTLKKSREVRKNVLSVFQLKFFLLHIEAFERNRTSDWLNLTVYPIRSFVTFKFTKSW